MHLTQLVNSTKVNHVSLIKQVILNRLMPTKILTSRLLKMKKNNFP